MNPTRNRSSIIYLLLFVAIIVMVVYQFQQQATTQESLTINELAADIQAGKVNRVIEDDNRLRVTYSDGTERESQKESDATLIQQLKELGVTTAMLSSENIKIEVKPPSAWLGIATALGYFIPFILLAGVFWFVFRQAQGSNNAAISFGKSRARMFTGDQPTVTFEDENGKTKVTLQLLFATAAERENAAKYGAAKGAKLALENLAGYLAKQSQALTKK